MLPFVDRRTRSGWCVLLAAALLAPLAAQGQESQGHALLAPGDQLAPSSGQVTATLESKGLDLTVDAGPEGYPGVAIKPPAGQKGWDLSAYGHIEARVVNTGKESLSVNVRIDDDGRWQDSPWNTEGAYLKPGASRTINVIFGYAYGHKPSYKLKSGAITQILIFTGKVGKTKSFRVESIEAGGPPGEKPPVNPAAIRIVPKDGVIVGPGVALNAAQQLKKENGAAAALDGSALNLIFPKKKGAKVVIEPPQGRWDLRQATAVRVQVTNIGPAPATVRASVASNSGWTESVSADRLAPGATTELTIPFAAAVPWAGVPDAAKTHWEGQKNTGTSFISDAVKSIVLATSGDAAKLRVSRIQAVVTTAETPSWLGQRPPIEGDWVKTFDDEFDGPSLDSTKWNIYGANNWDKQSHFSQTCVVLHDGKVSLVFKKEKGHQNDDANNPRVTPYATGYLDTYGKWTQTYGYFEARMKLPTAPGLWPAFWMMPDRGGSDVQWKRQDTGNGGMEFDIMEHLDRWGPYRYNIAMHWDGYGKHHKQTGTTNVYIQPDQDGYITAGLLWAPGSVTFYCNGQKVASWKEARISTVPADLMFTLPMGGWDNDALDDAKLPDQFTIDYVRCWQEKSRVGDSAQPSANAANP